MNKYFEIGMTVYSLIDGRGTVEKILECGSYCIVVKFNNIYKSFTFDGRDAERGPIVLSQKPIPHPEVINTPIVTFDRGELVWVWEKNMWQARFYSHKSNGNHYVFANQSKFNVVCGVAYSIASIVKFDAMPML